MICVSTLIPAPSLLYIPGTAHFLPGLLKLNEAVLRQPRLIVEVRMLHRQTALGGWWASFVVSDFHLGPAIASFKTLIC